MMSIKNNNENVHETEYLEKPSVSYLSLAPSSEAEDLELYKPIIDEILECTKEGTLEKKNKNIAITGHYGSGKSSIINSYFKDSNDVLYVTLGSYIEKKNSKDEKKKEQDIDRIETSILQQILYCVEPEQLPLSRINRIDKNVGRQELINLSISVILTIVFDMFFLINNKRVSEILDQNYKILIFSMVLCLVCGIAYVILNKIINYSFNKVSINGVELSKEESYISVLNRNIDELIHFFKQTNYNKIVFEDIDRLDNSIEIFSKLKEINMILNNALTKTIQFIYAIGDDVFKSSEERTKFFDGIIPIVPYSVPKVSRDLFEKYPNNDFNGDILKIICRYIENPRVVYDIAF